MFLLRDYFSEIEAALASKLTTWQVNHLSIWQDYVDTKSAPQVPGAEEVIAMEDEAQAARFREVKAKIARDCANMTSYNARVDENRKREHVVRVMHEKSQVQCGKEFLGHLSLSVVHEAMRQLHGEVASPFEGG